MIIFIDFIALNPNPISHWDHKNHRSRPHSPTRTTSLPGKSNRLAETKSSDPRIYPTLKKKNKKQKQVSLLWQPLYNGAHTHHANRQLYMMPSVGYTPNRYHTHVHIISEFINWSYWVPLQKRKKEKMKLHTTFLTGRCVLPPKA